MEVWKVEDLRAGMKGHGLTVLKGTRIETFQAELLGVLHNTSPGRDLVLMRLSGLNLDKTGVIAGMSGSPIYVEDKLVGAVAYAWPFGKEPIAGVTPFSQMQGFVEALEKRELAGRARPVRVGLSRPLTVGGRSFDSVTVATDFEDLEGDRKGLWMVPLRTPLAATGLTRHSLNLFAERTKSSGLVPMTGGAATAKVAAEARSAALVPGAPVALSLMTGDFDLSGIGTVTHVEGDRVYGWGHPFMSFGACQLPMMTGYIHTVYPRQTVSFKMGSPLREAGVIHADVSTCVAGTTGKKADLLPMRMTVRVSDDKPRTYNVQMARHRSVLPALAYTALTNSVDMDGDLPEDLTAQLHVKIALEGGEMIQIKEQFSALSGGRAPAVMYGFVANVLSQLAYNPFRELRVNRIDCETRVEPGRTTAEIEAVELDAESYAPGDTVRATVTLHPHRGARQRVALAMPLPDDLAEGSYTASVMDDSSSVRADLRGNPALNFPSSAEQVLEGIRYLTAAKRTALAMRVPVGTHGVAAGGKALPDLPGSMVRILSEGKRTGAAAIARALVARQDTRWVIQGGESVTFQVTKSRKAARQEE